MKNFILPALAALLLGGCAAPPKAEESAYFKANFAGFGWKKDKSAVAVFEGSVHVHGSTYGEADVPDGKLVPVSIGGLLGDLQPLDPASRREWEEFSKDADRSAAWTFEPFEDADRHAGDHLLEAKDEQRDFEKESDLLGERDDTKSGGAYGG